MQESTVYNYYGFSCSIGNSPFNGSDIFIIVGSEVLFIKKIKGNFSLYGLVNQIRLLPSDVHENRLSFDIDGTPISTNVQRSVLSKEHRFPKKRQTLARSLSTDKWFGIPVVVTQNGDIWVSVMTEKCVKVFSPSGKIKIIIGGKIRGWEDSNIPKNVMFNNPGEMAVCPDGSVLVCDNNCIRRINPNYNVTTLISFGDYQVNTIAVSVDGFAIVIVMYELLKIKISTGEVVAIHEFSVHASVIKNLCIGEAGQVFFTNSSKMTVNKIEGLDIESVYLPWNNFSGWKPTRKCHLIYSLSETRVAVETVFLVFLRLGVKGSDEDIFFYGEKMPLVISLPKEVLDIILWLIPIREIGIPL